MKTKPWKEWIPGVLSEKQIHVLCQDGYLSGFQDDDPEVIDYSSIDLCLGDVGWQMLEGSVKPFGPRYYDQCLKNQKMAKPLTPVTDGCFDLRSRSTYVFRLREHLRDLKGSKIWGQATAKSSIGRVDVLTRLIVDGMSGYEYFDSEHLAGGDEMFLEITPITFNVRVKPGTRLTQLRLFYGRPDDSEMQGQLVYESLLRETDPEASDGTLSADLHTVEVGGVPVAAFTAKVTSPEDPPIELWKSSRDAEANPCKHWRFWPPDGDNKKATRRLPIRSGQFYLIRSKEKIVLRSGVAVYCRAMDETIGEMRIHYAGFVHPFFGTDRRDGEEGTPLMFEVRGHDVNVSLGHAEKMARLIFYRMSEDAVERAKKDASKPAEQGEQDRYNNQTLELSKVFKKWPDRLTRGEDGRVEPA